MLLTGIFVIITYAALQLHISPLLFGSRAVLKGAVCPRRRFDNFCSELLRSVRPQKAANKERLFKGSIVRLC